MAGKGGRAETERLRRGEGTDDGEAGKSMVLRGRMKDWYEARDIEGCLRKWTRGGEGE